MGYEIERFVNKTIIDHLKCGICLEVLRDPMMISVCEHMFCRDCILDWLSTDTSCPEDRTPIEAGDLRPLPRALRNIYDKLEIRCDFAATGCKEVVPLLHLQSHLDDCELNKSDCVRDCGFKGTPNQIRGHDCVEYLKELVATLQVKEEASGAGKVTENSSNYDNLETELEAILNQIDSASNSNSTLNLRMAHSSSEPNQEFSEIDSFKERMKEAVSTRLRKPFSPESLAEIERILEVFEAVVKCKHGSKVELRTVTYYNNRIATVALKACAAFNDLDFIKDVVGHFRPLIAPFQEMCKERSVQVFNAGLHSIDKSLKLPKAFQEHFERVTVKGDGNCVWHSASIALFGDYSASEALRLLTAATLIEFEREFRGRFDEQEKKFGYKPDVTYDQLLANSVHLGVWGDEYHIVALSMAVRRPVYCYGGFDQFGPHSFSLPPGASADPYDIAKLIYEAVDTLGHYLFVGFEEDDNDDKEPNLHLLRRPVPIQRHTAEKWRKASETLEAENAALGTPHSPNVTPNH